MLDVFDALPAAQRLRARSYELITDKSLVVDVGCGAGRAAAELAELGGRAVGVDVDDDMVAVARERWPDVEFHLADATALPFDTGSVTGYRADKVLHVLADPAVALVEARRVLAPGGTAVLLGQDWDGFLIDASDVALTRTIVHARADTIATPTAARQYRNLLLDAGFAEPTVEVHTSVFTGGAMLPFITNIADAVRDAGVVTAAQVDGWVAEQEERARTDRLFIAVPMFMVAASRVS
jgi:ubiquinone/menaquinone biosynthesis C-methylase UbiE